MSIQEDHYNKSIELGAPEEEARRWPCNSPFTGCYACDALGIVPSGSAGVPVEGCQICSGQGVTHGERCDECSGTGKIFQWEIE